MTSTEKLIAWYEENKRELPFRKDRIPYRIWISEIMAQQTTINAMAPRFEEFVQQFPDVAALAAASEQDVLKAWQGLGYYSRARNLRKAAIVCTENWDGTLPQSKKDLKTLPGIGDYTAGAIASICFEERCTAIDANVLRMISRLHAFKEPLSSPVLKKRVETIVQNAMPEPSLMPSFTQALMELGALVCTPSSPICDSCPLKEECAAHAAHLENELPVKAAKKARTVLKKQYWLLLAQSEEGWKIHLHQRDNKGLLAGMYEFDESFDERIHPVLESEDLKPYTHLFTHQEWQMSAKLVLTEADETFVLLEEMKERYPLPSAFLPFFNQAENYIEKKEKDMSAPDL